MRGSGVSLIATWLIAHANLVAVNSQGELWEMEDKRAAMQLIEQFSCQQVEPPNQSYFGRLEFAESWQPQALNRSFYPPSFRLSQQPQRSRQTWHGEPLSAPARDDSIRRVLAS